MKVFKNEEGEVRSGWKILTLFLVEYLLLIIVANIISSQVIISSYIRENIYFILMFSQEIVLILTPILSWKVLFKKDLSLIGLKALNKKEVKNLILGLVMGIIAITLAFVLILISKSGVLVNSLLEPRFSLGLVVYFILFIFVGFAEELLSRGYIIGAMEVSNNNKWFAVMVSAVIFSLMHYGNNGFSLIPFLNILTLTRKVKEDEVLKRLPVIIFSSLITGDLRHKGESVGADAQLSKPEIEELIGVIDQLLGI